MLFIGGKRSWQRIFCEPREEPKHWLEKEDCLLCRKQSKWNCWGVSHREVLKQSLQKHRHNEPLAIKKCTIDYHKKTIMEKMGVEKFAEAIDMYFNITWPEIY